MATPQYGIYKDTTALIEYGFGLYNDTPVFEAASFSVKMPVIQSVQNMDDPAEIDILAASDITLYLPDTFQTEDVEKRIFLPERLYAPVGEGEKVGYLMLLYEGTPIANVELLAGESVISLMPPRQEALGVIDLADETKADEMSGGGLKRVLIIIAITAGGIGVLAAGSYITSRFLRRRNLFKRQSLYTRGLSNGFFRNFRHK
jgi:hypothetical protein